jgi:phage repressor protein C with HTH and peptisase S24 domain/DNA-binding XRE family transcriptional regulator
MVASHQIGARGGVASVNNIELFREQRGWKRPELARRMGTTPQQVERLEKGQRGLSVDWIDKAADALGVTPAQIITPVGDDGVAFSRTEPTSLDVVASEYGFAFLEELDLALGMGASFLDGHPEVRGLVPFKLDWLAGLHDGPLDRLKVVRGRGDSMQPTICDGDIVLIDTAHRRIDDQDRIWAIAYGDLGMIRRIRVTPRGTWQLMPDNQVVRPDEVGDGEVAVIGRVIWIGRRF